MHKPLNRIRLIHRAHPGTKARIRQPIAEAGDHVDDDKGGPRWMYSQDDVGDYMTGGGHDGDAALAEAHVDAGVCEGGDGVAGEGGKEDEGNDCVGEIVVFLELLGLVLE